MKAFYKLQHLHCQVLSFLRTVEIWRRILDDTETNKRKVQRSDSWNLAEYMCLIFVLLSTYKHNWTRKRVVQRQSNMNFSRELKQPDRLLRRWKYSKRQSDILGVFCKHPCVSAVKGSQFKGIKLPGIIPTNQLLISLVPFWLPLQIERIQIWKQSQKSMQRTWFMRLPENCMYAEILHTTAYS